MSTTPYLSNIKGARGAYDTELNGWSFVITATLTGIEGVGDYADVKQLYNSLVDSNVPLAGSDLGLETGIADLEGCWLRNIESDPLGDGQFHLTLTYQSSQWGITQIDVGSQLSQIETTNDLFGDPIKLFYTYPSDYGGIEPNKEQSRLRVTGEVDQGGTVTIFRPEGSRIYTVRETTDPSIPQNLYEGKVNDAVWWFKEAREWLCTSITGTSDNAGTSPFIPLTFINRYEFQYKIGGWDPEAVYSDDLTGDPVPDPVADEGIQTIIEYDEFDFTELFSTPF